MSQAENDPKSALRGDAQEAVDMLKRRSTAQHRLFADRAARWVVTAGGLAIIASILGILAFILVEVLPILGGARVEAAQPLAVEGAAPRAMVLDEYQTFSVELDSDGSLRATRLADGKVEMTLDVLAASPGSADAIDSFGVSKGSDDAGMSEEPGYVEGGEALSAAANPLTGEFSGPKLSAAPQRKDGNLLVAGLDDGRALVQPVSFAVEFVGDERLVRPDLPPPTFVDLSSGTSSPVIRISAAIDEIGGGTIAGQLADRRLVVVRREVEENMFTGEIEESSSRGELELSVTLTALAVGEEGKNLFGASAAGEIFWWDVRDSTPKVVTTGSTGGPAVTSLELLLGSRTLIVGDAEGGLSAWFPLTEEGGVTRLARVRDFEPMNAPIADIDRAPRDKRFAVVAADGGMAIYHSTTGKRRSDLPNFMPPSSVSGVPGLVEAAGVSLSVAFAPKGDGLTVAGEAALRLASINDPHPEISWKSLFGKVWYEGYGEPAYVWQSSSASDDFEPKLSLTPLMIGTLKGTLFSLLLAIPLGIFGAMYLSHFMHPRYKSVLKPVIEIMAALPSVILGFLAGLWLAPRMEKAVPSLILGLVFVPLAILLCGWVWNLMPTRLRHRLGSGSEVFAFLLGIAAAGWVAVQMGPLFEGLVFGGSFQSWLLNNTGLPFDQRNAIVVGIAMGFAVIPIIFAISEDAFSNVPPNLIAGSLALGANRWQTVTRVVLPTASPGIFSAVMVGFGRAIGETMIVLMATGNTPILDWNPFSGFRTLSANIAVEIPEAPHSGTLYRTLFLAALALFVMTFLINTVAELVRQRLRERYSSL